MSVSWIFKLKQSSLIAEPNPSQAYDWYAIIEFDNGVCDWLCSVSFWRGVRVYKGIDS